MGGGASMYIKETTEIWDYSQSDKGPENWHQLCPEFSVAAEDKWQSPIGLSKEIITKKAPNELIFHYHEDEFTLRHDNYTLQLDSVTNQSYLIYKGEHYFLKNLHFHIPSEHVLNNRPSDLEFHFVHRNERDELLVLAILFDVTDEKEAILARVLYEQDRLFVKFDFTPFTESQPTYYHYQGSLTTPPTIGQVTWLVIDDRRVISTRGFSLLKSTITSASNNRPLQPINNREIYHT
ncbi:hypothetical protein FE258_02250 [Vagococcus zengguangii]|nr:hypothetical protein FE258_02250 [Vagococcus zengguangii]